MKTYLTLFVLSVTLYVLSSCQKEETAIDAALFKEVEAGGFIYYQGDNTVQQSNVQGGHSAYFRVRYNPIAFAALTDSGKIPIGSSFPEGSLVVKEQYSSITGSIKKFAVMKKSNTSEASAGWVWAEYNADGSVNVSVSKKGETCIGCHTINSRDYNRIFDLYP